MTTDATPPPQPVFGTAPDRTSDGYLIVRHPDLETTLAMADKVGTEIGRGDSVS